MNKRNTIFILCVLAFALVFAAMSISNLGKLVSENAIGAGGKSRDVDMEIISRQIKDGRLSDHEALFYKKAPQ